MKRSKILLLIAAAVMATSGMALKNDVEIHFTEVPHRGQGAASEGNIAGAVSNLSSPQEYKIVLYARTDKWYVQPEVDSPFTDVEPDGSWGNWTHLGSRYGAILVSSSYQPAATLRSLPPLGNGVLAKKEVAARE